MKRVVFKNSEAVANFSGAMEADTIQKHGRSSKSQKSRGNILRRAFLLGLSTVALSLVFVACDKEVNKKNDNVEIEKSDNPFVGTWVKDFNNDIGGYPSIVITDNTWTAGAGSMVDGSILDIYYSGTYTYEDNSAQLLTSGMNGNAIIFQGKMIVSNFSDIDINGIYTNFNDVEEPETAPQLTVEAIVGGGAAKILEDGDDIEGIVGEAVEFVISFEKGKSRISGIEIITTRLGGAIPIMEVDEVFGAALGRHEVDEFSYNTTIGSSQEILKITAIDTRNRVSEVSITIKVRAEEIDIPSDIDAYFYYTKSPVIQLGAQSHYYLGSFFSVGMMKRFYLYAAAWVSDVIDFMYFHQNDAIIAAPSENYHYLSTTLNPANWNTRNATKFYRIQNLSGTDPNEWDPDWWWEAMDEIDYGVTKVEGLQPNDVVFFKTSGTGTSYEGAFIVTSVAGTTNGSISFQFIYQHEVYDY